ncbi:hypothetical protein VOLCADRAFT_57409 [Volvox carteri f. nagariensis]|uniref:Ferredoxin n=1 Tax=Volvox carteri f. nagariensis TaxID=3068 RepID=D8TMX2_VOLCA|nr:uncharacterized protein VOLCADRAFT_57409 [Volvox carteri f. nagariensis]EFJ51203.1 hypothetical protein VOLCADRAFT_57409 [Volvox carteri f. nagariensis]|eukprot:XP_002947670.1 hypothetical protein VOLCADRAFT_57409 [Volvox carteri f. nagariensis]
MKECIDNCRECERICLETIPYCLSKGVNFHYPLSGSQQQNCAAMCNVSARFMISRSRLHVRTCAVCREVCEACAEDCEGLMGADDECMRSCAEACRMCATTCADMATRRP